ncbi:hypothetical protein CXB51_020134 [Gossypium anomalum]|uniref:RNase H type-1 domain-containing protein n=1 Tax=Gossypium anomalum TaxID=47600 RepID=A0A8J5YX95_9ROSI|nr:hypothetical protein CXB51_020134 [Gossypium anomalum]
MKKTRWFGSVPSTMFILRIRDIIGYFFRPWEWDLIGSFDRNFGRLGHGILLTGVHPTCPRCKAPKEDVMYALRDCPISREALTMSIIHNYLLCMSYCSVIGWLKATMWEARNLFVIQGRVSSLQDAILKAFSIHHDFRVHNLLYAPLLPGHEVKINVDTTLNKEMRSTFCGVIVRDHEGMMLVGFSCSFTKAFDASSAEALALACAAQKAFKKGFSRTLDLSLYGCIVKRGLRDFTILLVLSVNCVAHYLARWLMDGNVALKFSLDYPNFVHWLVLDDTL